MATQRVTRTLSRIWSLTRVLLTVLSPFTDGEGEEEEEEAKDIDGDEGTIDEDEDEDVGLDERGALDGEKRETFDEQTKEVKKSLHKIKLSFAIIHSTTILLPAWRKICRKCKLKDRMIPRDVRTHWNSTYDMLQLPRRDRCDY
ncbi:hypothetical protein B0H17DRAFT_1217343 [Mycena rosella]|uniref:Uncharacterized protein n=1 Tax=Mycena rosella TaxID=1033263 RepID=A0AAD7BY67_MYCRO|nr:hypothetical protein B0H17DRAFT_1217343 [Mycena rosella]